MELPQSLIGNEIEVIWHHRSHSWPTLMPVGNTCTAQQMMLVLWLCGRTRLEHGFIV